MREITLSQAVNEALAEEMRRDETVFIIGEDVAEAGTPLRCCPVWLRSSARSALSTHPSANLVLWGWPSALR